ncbi:hypothetical protein D3C85_1423180 [compost metagenome]
MVATVGTGRPRARISSGVSAACQSCAWTSWGAGSGVSPAATSVAAWASAAKRWALSQKSRPVAST